MAKRKARKPAYPVAPALPPFPPPLEVPPEIALPNAPLADTAAWAAYAAACASRAESVLHIVAEHSRKRIAAADAREPIDYREQHKPIPDAVRVVEQSQRQVSDVNGRIGAPKRANDVLAALHRNGTIDDAQLSVGREFEEQFRLANLDPLRAPDLRRVPGQASGDALTDPQVAKDRVWRALNLVGGLRSNLGRVLWDVLGEGRTLNEYAQSAGSYMHPQTASHLLCGALGVLASGD